MPERPPSVTFGDHLGMARSPREAQRNMLTAVRSLGVKWLWIEAPRLLRIGHRRWGWHAVGVEQNAPTPERRAHRA